MVRLVAAVGQEVGRDEVAIQARPCPAGLPKVQILTLDISASTRRQGTLYIYTGGPGGVVTCTVEGPGVGLSMDLAVAE